MRVVLAEDNLLVREGLQRLLSAAPDLDIVAACADLDSTLDAIREEQPDIVLTDIRMPPNRADEGLRVADYCRVGYPTIGVILLSQYVEISYVRNLLAAG